MDTVEEAESARDRVGKREKEADTGVGVDIPLDKENIHIDYSRTY